MRRKLVGIGFVAILVISTAGIGYAQQAPSSVRGEPDLDVYAPEATLTPGTTDELALQIANDGRVSWGAPTQRDLVTTARNVRVEAEADDAPFSIETDQQAIGAVSTDQPGIAPLTVRVPADAEPGEYSIDVRLRYSYTSQYAARNNVGQERTRSVRRTVEVTVDDRPRFVLRTVDNDVQIGDSGTVTVGVTNVGDEDAHDLDVSVGSNSPSLSVGGAASDVARIERLNASETATVTYDVDVEEGAAMRRYSFYGSVRFTDTDGVRSAVENLSFGIRPTAEQSITVEIENASLRVGESGTITGTIRNDGPQPMESVSLALGEGRFGPRNGTYAVGDLGVGETATFQFRETVPTSADPAPHRIDVTTSYRTESGTDRSSVDPIRIPVLERRDAVELDAASPTFAAGESGTLRLNITNLRDTEIRNVRVRLTVDPPLESEFRSGVVPELAPGESDQVAFDVEIDGDAPVSRYPATVEVEYTDSDDETTTARPATVAVEVTETDDELPVSGVLAAIVVLLLVIGGGWWFYGKRLI